MKRKKIRIKLSKTFWFVLGIYVLVVLVSITAFRVWYYLELYSKAKELEKVTALYVQAQERAYKKQSQDNFGGQTPFDVLYRYTEILEAEDLRLASTYFIKENRGAELTRFNNVSHEDFRKFIDVLKEAQKKIEGVKPSGNTYSITKPIPMSFEQVEPGVWQIKSLEYSF